MRRVYFDNAATTPIHPQVFERMKPYFTTEYGNPSSIHSFGRTIRVAIEEARETIADFINADPSEIYFTSGGTEANNFVINGIVHSEFGESGRNEIITSKVEHHCVLDPFEELGNKGFNVKWVDVDRDTKVTPAKIFEMLLPNTSFVSLIHVNNETGSINPIEAIVPELKKKNIFINVDAVQSFGKIKIDVKELRVDSFCGSAHKINGPKGVGFAFIRSGTPMHPLLLGGSQERNRRGGTENVTGIIGLAEAVRIRKQHMTDYYSHVSALREKFIEGLRSLDKENIFINGGDDASPYILSITLNSDKYKNDPEAMTMYLDINGVAVSNGSACTSGTIKASHVMLAIGYKPEDAAGTIRFSFGYQNTTEDVDIALDVMKKFFKNFQK